MIINAVVFVLQGLVANLHPDWVYGYLALSLPGLAHGFVWQLFTFQFLHAGLLHLVGNLIGLYFFGRTLEDHLGRPGLLKLYLGSGVAGGLLQMLLALLVPSRFGGMVVGASAGVFGLVAAFATLYPHRTITLLLFFVLPVSLRARTLLWIAVAIAILGILGLDQNSMVHIAHGAHLGGILAGVGYVYALAHGFQWRMPWPRVRIAKRPSRPMVRAGRRPGHDWRRPEYASDGEVPPEEFISREVDPILDKISAHGIQSLTERERRILEAARNRMSKR
jgi:membrane associated rhomboid family serine protease